MAKEIITTKDLLGFKELEARTGIAGSTIRRYGAKFKKFLPYRVIGRQIRYKPEVVETFQRINALYAEGRRSDEVAAILADEIPHTHGVSTSSTAIATHDPAETVVELTRAVNRVSEALAAQAEVKPMVEKLALAVESLAKTQAETLELLRAQQAQLAEARLPSRLPNRREVIAPPRRACTTSSIDDFLPKKNEKSVLLDPSKLLTVEVIKKLARAQVLALAAAVHFNERPVKIAEICEVTGAKLQTIKTALKRLRATGLVTTRKGYKHTTITVDPSVRLGVVSENSNE